MEGTLEVARRYRVLGLPTSFFVGADGVLENVSVGPLTPQTLAEALLKIGVTWNRRGYGVAEGIFLHGAVSAWFKPTARPDGLLEFCVLNSVF